MGWFGALGGMDLIKSLFVVLLLSVGTPALGQDWLDGLQELANELTAPAQDTRSPPPAGPKPPERPVVERPKVAPVLPPVPLPRPDFDGATDAEAETPPTDDAEPMGEEVAAPAAEPARVYQGACPAVLQGFVDATMGDPIEEGACGIQSPLVVTAVLSRGRMVPLSSPVTTSCAMASALPGWVAQVDGYASAMLDSALAQINTGPGYMCRLRNNGETGFVSEHGFANALDISGFTLADGRTIAVKTDWLPGNAPQGRMLRLAHDAACGAFTTVLGPEANADHDDHLHLDLGCHGQSCTALICE